jgi:short-subunit dehydrogenase
LEIPVLLEKKWIVITGGSSGIGAAIAKGLAGKGNRVTIVAHSEEPLQRALLDLRSHGVTADAVRCDIGSPADVDALAQTLLADGSAPDVLINNAGFGTYRPFEAADIDEIDRLLNVNLNGHVRLTKKLGDEMVRKRSGAICFMASIAGRLPITPNASYCAAKHGMLGLAQALRFELRRFGVEVTAVCPGRVDTAFFDHETFQRRTLGPENKSAVPVERVADATIRAIEKNRAMTYIPKSLGIAAWLYDAFPLVLGPLFSRMTGNRIERLYADARL